MASGSILVVDDEPDIRELVREILQDEGYEVSIAEDADTAREARRGGNPDLALLDIWMPRTDGINDLNAVSPSTACSLSLAAATFVGLPVSCAICLH